MTDRPVVYVDIRRSLLRRALGGRAQPWYWVAKRGGNNRRLARSTERYTNRQDCLDAVTLVFSASTIVYRREAGQGDLLLRPFGDELLR